MNNLESTVLPAKPLFLTPDTPDTYFLMMFVRRDWCRFEVDFGRGPVQQAL
jgi:hypothetical protein